MVCIAVMLMLFACGDDKGITTSGEGEGDGSGEQPEPSGKYEMVWSDEFNYTGAPDASKWNFETGASGWGNNELQYYTRRTENASVADGVLTITAREEDYQGADYTSARMITYGGGHYWKYGRMEARIKLPEGKGIWPAFWMLGRSIFEGTQWPRTGEIDILEMIGGGENNRIVHGTAHWEENGHQYQGGSTTLSQNLSQDFHTFAVEWDSNRIRWFIDGQQYYSLNTESSAMSEFDNQFFILLNIAVGGNWPGAPDASTQFPQTMQVDYVRVYQK